MAKFLVLCLLAGQAFAKHNDNVLDYVFNSGLKVMKFTFYGIFCLSMDGSKSIHHS